MRRTARTGSVPELPEVETVRRGLAQTVIARRIESVEVGRERTVRRTSARALIDGLLDTSITAVTRRGKYLVCPLDSGDALMIHLRMSGRVLMAERGSPRPAHTHVVLTMGNDEMRFVDPRTFGEMVVFDPDHTSRELPELGRLGVDPVADPFDASVLRDALVGTRRGIKGVLLDQHRVAGLGNIYSDEVLHRAGVRYDRPTDALRPREVNRMADAISQVLGDAIDHGGSTLDDTQYVDVLGQTGDYQHFHLVYGREGERCLTCEKAAVRRATVGGRSTFFCPRCQR